MLERVKMWMDVGLHYNRVWTGASERLPLCAGQRTVGQQFGGAKSSHDDYAPPSPRTIYLAREATSLATTAAVA